VSRAPVVGHEPEQPELESDAGRHPFRPRGTREPARGWPLGLPARAARRVLWATILGWFVDMVYYVRPVGVERLRDVEGPVIFAANHCAHLDNAFIIVALPGRWRRRMAIAAATDDIFGPRHLGLPVKGWLAQLLGNAFAFSQRGRRPARIDHLQALLDREWSVLLFPEGRLTVCGPIQPFKAGIGLLAVETKVPVVPVRVEVLRRGYWEGGGVRRGAVDVRFGEPMTFADEVEPEAATDRLEAAVRAL
jgi:long-chain acyl-CoA synthetase